MIGSGRPPDDTGCPILHVDMDAFFASVEVRRHRELAGRPMYVAGHGPRGVVLSATYEARAFGVHSAMPVAQARRLCPQALCLPADPAAYAAASRRIMAIFAEVTPLVEPISSDEAFLDVAGAFRRLGRPRQIGEWIRARVADDEGLSCSVGVAATKFVAKLASSRCKPDGLLVVPRADTIAFLHPLPVSALWGVGERTREQLARLGLRRIGDIAATPTATLCQALGPAAGEHLAALAWGRDPRPVLAEVAERSVGAETTFPRDVDNAEQVRRELLRLAERTATRARARNLAGRTVVIKIRFADFRTITRSRTLPEPTDVGQEIYRVGLGLYEAMGLQRARLRLVGVRLEGLVDAGGVSRQLRLDTPAHGWSDLERAADRANRRFGRDAVRPATLVDAAAPVGLDDRSQRGAEPVT